jgi:hypothetical protein
MPPWAEFSPLRPWRAASDTGRRGFRYALSGKKAPWRQGSDGHGEPGSAGGSPAPSAAILARGRDILA